MKKKAFIFILLLVIFSCTTIVYAGLLDDIITSGNNIEADAYGWSTSIRNYVEGDVKSAIASIGYLIFAIVIIFLGIKYMWSGYEGKSAVKHTLPAFCVALLLFYFASTVVDIIVYDAALTSTDWATFSGNIYATAALIAQYISFGILIFVGLKYMFESSEGKAQIKETLAPLIIGVIFVFASSQVVSFIINAQNQILN